jgi:hypothetical protein
MKKFSITGTVTKSYRQNDRTWTYCNQVPVFLLLAKDEDEARQVAEAIVREKYADRPSEILSLCVVAL